MLNSRRKRRGNCKCSFTVPTTTTKPPVTDKITTTTATETPPLKKTTTTPDGSWGLAFNHLHLNFDGLLDTFEFARVVHMSDARPQVFPPRMDNPRQLHPSSPATELYYAASSVGQHLQQRLDIGISETVPNWRFFDGCVRLRNHIQPFSHEHWKVFLFFLCLTVLSYFKYKRPREFG